MKTILYIFISLSIVIGLLACDLEEKITKEAEGWLAESTEWRGELKAQRELIQREREELEKLREREREIDEELNSNKVISYSKKANLRAERRRAEERRRELEDLIREQTRQAQEREERERQDRVEREQSEREELGRRRRAEVKRCQNHYLKMGRRVGLRGVSSGNDGPHYIIGKLSYCTRRCHSNCTNEKIQRCMQKYYYQLAVDQFDNGNCPPWWADGQHYSFCVGEDCSSLLSLGRYYHYLIYFSSLLHRKTQLFF